MVTLQNWQPTSPFSKPPLLVCQYYLLSKKWVIKPMCVPNCGKKFPDCARVIPIRRSTADICLPRNSCSERTCVTACHLVVLMHVWRSTAGTLRSFPAHFLGGSGRNEQHFFPLPLLAMKRQPSQNNKRIVLQICHMAAPRLSSGLESSASPHPSWTGNIQNMHPSAVHITCGRKPLRQTSMC